MEHLINMLRSRHAQGKNVIFFFKKDKKSTLCHIGCQNCNGFEISNKGIIYLIFTFFSFVASSLSQVLTLIGNFWVCLLMGFHFFHNKTKPLTT